MGRPRRSCPNGNVPFVDPEFAEELTGRRTAGRKPSRGGDGEKGRHKTLQLCRQVQRALSLCLGGECGDEVLRSLYVESVEPAPDASRLLVRVIMPRSMHISPIEVLGRLDRVSGTLRAEVARAITRKRAPELSFLPVVEVLPKVADAGEVSP